MIVHYRPWMPPPSRGRLERQGGGLAVHLLELLDRGSSRGGGVGRVRHSHDVARGRPRRGGGVGGGDGGRRLLLRQRRSLGRQRRLLRRGYLRRSRSYGCRGRGGAGNSVRCCHLHIW